jgi:lipopolysaccharide export system permease protein
MKKGLINIGSNIFFQDANNRIVTIRYYDVNYNQANQVSIQEFDPNDLTKLISRTDAYRMKFDTLKNGWTLYNGTSRIFNDINETFEKFETKDYYGLNFTPDEVIKKQRKPEEMSLPELSNYADEQQRTGNNPTSILIEYQSRIAFAFSSVVVVLFGLPISANRRRGGLALQVGINLLITFAYLVFMKVSQAFGKNGVLNPFITAWLANFIFLTAAIFNIKKAAK